MRRHGIPTAAYEIFEDADQAVAYLEGLEAFLLW
jgi:phosphoribosylamine-glycine ligase